MPRNKMGRPPLPKAERRDRLVTVRLTGAEYKMLCGIARERGMRPRDALRLVLTVPLPLPADTAAEKGEGA